MTTSRFQTAGALSVKFDQKRSSSGAKLWPSTIIRLVDLNDTGEFAHSSVQKGFTPRHKNIRLATKSVSMQRFFAAQISITVARVISFRARTTRWWPRHLCAQWKGNMGRRLVSGDGNRRVVEAAGIIGRRGMFASILAKNGSEQIA